MGHTRSITRSYNILLQGFTLKSGICVTLKISVHIVQHENVRTQLTCTCTKIQR
jgi:hypothetical protein